MIYLFGDIHFRENNAKTKVNWEFNNAASIPFIDEVGIQEDDTVILMGDIFDRTKHQGIVNQYAIEFIQAIRDITSSIYIITGNHEVSAASGNNLSILKTINGVHVCEDITFILTGGIQILALPHIDGRSYSNYLQSIKEFIKDESPELVLGHHFFPENAIMDSPSMDLDSVYDKYKYWIMGHYHKFEKISDKKWCTGSLWPCNKGEADYDFSYMTYDKGELKQHQINPKYFSQFRFYEWGVDAAAPDSKDHTVVTVHCRKVEKASVEAEIRKQYAGTLYDIVWEYIEEEKDETIDVKSDNDLETAFFKEEKVSSDVKDMCLNYLKTGSDS